ncbi:MAG: hypothetical protein LPL29_12110, partial [Alphaproteobacteria bacterium]|nr:hypothetical protein [Alphaproteobacteria bacterium]
RRLTEGSFYRSDDAKAIVNPAEQFETRWNAAINSAKRNLGEWKSAFEDMQDYNERRGYSSKDIRGFGAGFLLNMSMEDIEESTRQLFVFAEAMDFVASKVENADDADLALKGISDLIAPIGQYVAALEEITKQEDGGPFKPALEQLVALEAKLIATSEKLSGYWDKTADMGAAEKAWQAVLDKVNANLAAITKTNEEIKGMPDVFREMEGDPIFEKLFGTMTDQQRAAMLDKWIDRINELGSGQKVKKITADVAELMRTLNDPQQSYMAERAGELMGLANPVDELRKSGIIQAFEKLGDISFSGSIKEINAEADIAAAQIDKLIGLIYELFAIEGTSDIPEALRAAAEETRRQLEENRERNIAAVTNRAASQRMQALEKELNKVKSVSEAYAGAADALKTLLMSPDVTAAQANVDREKIAQGELDRAGALSLMNEEQLRELDLKGALVGQQEELIELQLEAARLKSREYVDTQAQLSLLNLMLDNERARISYRERMSPRFQAQLIEAEHQKVLDEIQLNQLRMAYAGSEQGKSDFLALEIQKLEMERQNIEMQMLVMQDEKYRGEFLRLEMDKLAMESAVLAQKLELLRNPEYVQKERLLELQREEVELQQLMNEYTVSFGQYLATNIVESATSVSNALSGAFTDFITGAKSMKDIFRDLLKGMIQGIISMFAQWAAQWLVALALQKLGMSFVTSTTTAAAGAATAAWTPAAVAASIATMGAALGFGPPAVAMIAASGAMVGALNTLGGAAPGGVTAPGGGSLDMAAGLFHTGGLFSGNGGFGLRSDEGLAILQDGELIVRRQDVGATLAAMNAFNVPIPSGAKYHDGGIYGDDGMGKSFYGKLSGRQVQVVNYFDYADVERHLARNPDAILNVIQSDQRNNGVMRRNRG